MAQQINLFSPLLLSRKQVFTARTMLLALGVFMVMVGLMTWYGVSVLRASGDASRLQLAERATERARLTEAIRGKSNAEGHSREQIARAADSLAAELRGRRAVLAELQQGLVLADDGHAARLRLVAQTIPQQAWITELVFDKGTWVLTGATTLPAALNDWMTRLSQHPLLSGQQFSSVKVEKPGFESQSNRWTYVLASQVRAPASSPEVGARP